MTKLVKHSGGKATKPLTLHEAMARMFDDSFASPFSLFGDADWAANGRFTPSIDLSETEKEIQVVADVPGYDKKDLKVEVEDGVLTISGTMQEANEEKKKYYCKQCSSGSFVQRIRLSENADEEHIKSSIKNGKLRVQVPKRTVKDGGKGRTINIEG